jgi:hypothetical protein
MTQLDARIEALTPETPEYEVRAVLVLLHTGCFDERTHNVKADAIRRRTHMARATFRRLHRHTQAVPA